MTDTSQKLRLGGMALRNGLLVHGPTHWSAACRRKDGTIGIASGRKPRVHLFDDVPGLRGVVRLGEAMAVIPLVKKSLPEAQLPFEDPKVAGAAASASLASSLIRRRTKGRRTAARGEAAAAALSVLPTVVALRSGDLAAFHGAEHMAIGEYESGTTATKEHDRCGSHLMAPLVVANMAGAALLKRLVSRPTALHGGVVALGSMAFAVEVFGWTERHPDTTATKAIKVPGHELQRVLGTRDPSDDQLEVGRAALAEILRVESADGRDA